MKQPWLKFYPNDWRGDLSLGPCSLAARGLWMEMLCIMSDAEPRGSLVKEGEQYTAKRLAAVARAPVKEVEKLLAELESEGVFSRDEDGTIYSRRMRRDVEKAERDKANGQQGGNPNLKAKGKGGVNPPDKGQDKAQKPETRSQNPEAKSSLRSDGAGGGSICDRFFAAYPKHAAEDGVRRELERLTAEGARLDDIVAGAKRYAAEVAGKPPDKIANPVGWLRDGRWKDGTRRQETRDLANTFVRRSEPLWAGLAARYQREKGKPPPPTKSDGWAFPNEWVAEVRDHATNGAAA